MLKIVDRYLLKSFLKPFGGTVAVFMILVAAGRFFEKISTFTRYEAASKDIVLYLAYTMPFWLNTVLPVATLLAVLFGIGALQSNKEITAFWAGGVSSVRMFSSLFATSLVLALVSLAAGLTILPEINFKSRTIYRVNIKKQEALRFDRHNLVVAGRGGTSLTIGQLDPQENRMVGVVMDRFNDQSGWVESITAREAVYADGQWLFKNGVRITPDPDQIGSFQEVPFEQEVLQIPEKPEDFIVKDKHTDDMTAREILARIKRLDALGKANREERVAFHMKLALPFANVIVMGIGIPFALKSSQRGKMGTFGYALGMAFLYWGLASVGQSMGERGLLAPWLAAWTSNVVFLGVGFWLNFRADS